MNIVVPQLLGRPKAHGGEGADALAAVTTTEVPGQRIAVARQMLGGDQ